MFLVLFCIYPMNVKEVLSKKCNSHYKESTGDAHLCFLHLFLSQFYFDFIGNLLTGLQEFQLTGFTQRCAAGKGTVTGL